MYKLYCRGFQYSFKFGAYFLPLRKPSLIVGVNSIVEIPKLLDENRVNNILIVTDHVIPTLGIMNPLLKALDDKNISYSIYDGTVPNPTIDNIEEAYAMYLKNKSQAILAFGGGSAIDCAKGVGARVARPNKSIPQMKGLFKVLRSLPLLIAVPTTSGTGSEATVACIVTNSPTHEKYAINDLSLVPRYAVLDPIVTINLPPHVTSTTGMDALTHAIEAYLNGNRSNTRETKEISKEAVKLVFENLLVAYQNGENIEARANMQRASYLAGRAFTRAMVGYVHAIAHTLGGFYSTPHGLANAVILPYVLDAYGDKAHEPLAELAEVVGITGSTKEEKSHHFIQAIRKMNQEMNIPTKIAGIKEADLPIMVKRAIQEANPLYPVPKIMGREELLEIYKQIME